MRKAKKWLALLMAIGMTVGVASCAGGQAKADANDPATEKYLPTISVAVQGQTIALLEGDVYKFASNYSIGCGKDYTEGDFMVDRYAPKPATLTWENSREGALYYTVKVGLDKELSDADSYLVQDTSIDIDYLFVGKHYYYQIYAHYENDEVVKSRVFDFYTADLPRTVYIDGVSNTRDLGGRLTVDGTHRVKQGMVYRGGEVDHSWGNITEEGKRVMLYELGIKTDLDLRNAITYTTSPIDSSLNYINVSAPHYVSAEHGIDSAAYKDALITEIRTFANPDNYPIYLHCSLGRDRAGTLSFLINALLGVGKMDLYRDYEISHFSVNGWADADQSAGKLNETVAAFTRLYNYIRDYGTGTLAENTEKFMTEYLGITKDEINSIRAIMLEEV